MFYAVHVGISYKSEDFAMRVCGDMLMPIGAIVLPTGVRIPDIHFCYSIDPYPGSLKYNEQ